MTAFPRKTRELESHHFDSTVWNDYRFRDGDVIVATYGKSGTTWTQQIVGQILFRGDESVDLGALSPWLDLRVPPKEVKLDAMEAQTHRRFLKTHLRSTPSSSARGAISLHRARRPRRGLESLQPSCPRQRDMVRGAQRFARPCRTAHRAHRSRRRVLFPPMARPGRIPVLAVLGEHPQLVADPWTCRT